jgi:hypothetical protein
MLQSVNKFSADPGLQSRGSPDSIARISNAIDITKATPMMILPHIAESTHGTNPAARVRAIFINDECAMSSGDSEMEPDAFSLLGGGVRAKRIDRIQRLRGVSKRHLGGCLKCIQENQGRDRKSKSLSAWCSTRF